METTWHKAKAEIKKRISDTSYKMWIQPMTVTSGGADELRLVCPNDFSRKWVHNHYHHLISTELTKIIGQVSVFIIDVASKKEKLHQKKENHIQLPLPNFIARSHSGRFFRKNYTFDQFVVGSNNEFAFSASLSVASKNCGPQQTLFLLSKTGMGKTHLSHAIGHHIINEFPSDRVYYITVEDFANEMIQAFRHNAIDQFKKKYRNGCDVLLLEDVQYLTGKERTQIELSTTLDSLMEEEKRIIFSGSYLPADIPKLNNELKSRLSCSLISKIERPNFRTRVRILKKKSRTNGNNIPEDVIHFLAEELTEDVRQLESGLNGVTARSSLMGIPVNMDLARAVVKNIATRRNIISIESIKKLVCEQFQISTQDIMSPSRKLGIVRPRQIAIYLSRKYTDAPLHAIGKSFNRYHATALHAVGVIEKGLQKKGPLKKQVEILCRKLESGK